MRYYMVNRTHYTGKGHELIETELITAKEMKHKYPEVFPLHYIKRGILTEIEVSKNKTFHFFGLRLLHHGVEPKVIEHNLGKGWLYD